PVQSWAAVSFADISAAASGSTSVAPAYSASTADGDLLVLCVVSKHAGTASVPSTPANWTAPPNNSGDSSGGDDTVTGTNDQGATRATMFYRVASGGCCTSGTQSVTITSGNSSDSYMIRLSNATGSWDVATAAGSDNTRGAN